MRVYFKMFGMGIQEVVIYRGKIFVWVLVSVVWVLVLPFIWLTAMDGREIGGYRPEMMTTYFLLMPMVDSLVTFYVFEMMHENIKSGDLAMWLLRPTRYFGFRFSVEAGWKTIRTVLTLATMIVFILLLPLPFEFPAPSPLWLAFVPAILLGGVLSFLFGLLIGMAAFWTTQAGWVKHLWWVVTNFVTGAIAPIVFYPEAVQAALALTPFPMMIQTPIRVLMGTITWNELGMETVIGLVWVALLLLLNRWVWRIGLRRFEPVGT